MFKATVTAAFVALTLAGCAHPEPQYSKPGATAQDLAAAKWECKREATAIAPVLGGNGYYFASPKAVRAATRECMAAHGWQVQPGS